MPIIFYLKILQLPRNKLTKSQIDNEYYMKNREKILKNRSVYYNVNKQNILENRKQNNISNVQKK